MGARLLRQGVHPAEVARRVEVHRQSVSRWAELLNPYDARAMRSYPVSSRVNHVANDDEECSKPVEIAQIQSRLFV